MSSLSEGASVSRGSLWTGRIVSTIMSLLLLMDGVMKLLKPREVVEGTTRLGYPESVIVGIGVTLLAATALYLVPRTAILGAILLTGYLGGAVATHVRVGAGIFNIVFPVIFGAPALGRAMAPGPPPAGTPANPKTKQAGESGGVIAPAENFGWG